MQCCHELKSNVLKFGQDTDSRAQAFCFPFTFWDRQNRQHWFLLLAGGVLFLCFEVILPFWVQILIFTLLIAIWKQLSMIEAKSTWFHDNCLQLSFKHPKYYLKLEKYSEDTKWSLGSWQSNDELQMQAAKNHLPFRTLARVSAHTNTDTSSWTMWLQIWLGWRDLVVT